MLTIREMKPGELEQLLAEENADRAAHALTPEDLMPLAAFIEHRRRPGDFLYSVLTNDLVGAMGRADTRNRRRVFEYVEWLYNNAPGLCWGSEKYVEDWLIGKDTARN